MIRWEMENYSIQKRKNAKILHGNKERERDREKKGGVYVENNGKMGRE